MTTPYKSPEELATAVMRKLGMIDMNKQPTAVEQAGIIEIYHDKFEELAAEDLVYWPVTEIPRAVFGAITRIVGAEFATVLGKDIPTEQNESGDAVALGINGMRMLRRLMARDATGLPTKANYF